jgi:phosphopantothenate---cysteine ligase (CTP)
MNILVTAGNSIVPIDRVRCITNIFTGRTGTQIALHARERGHAVTLLTSHPEVVAELSGSARVPTASWTVRRYRTFADIHDSMEHALREERYDALIHCAAVSDFQAAGVYAPRAGTAFDSSTRIWQAQESRPPTLIDCSAGKVSSAVPELWLRLVPTLKLIDFVREPWGFEGVLIKFKLEVDVRDEELLEIAEGSRRHSRADLMVANTLEGTTSWAFLGPCAGRYERLSRLDLPTRLIDEVERLHRERSHG